MRVRSLAMIASGIAVVSCAAVLGLPDPTLDDTIPVGGGSSGNASSSGSSGGGDGSTTDGSGDDGSTLVDGGGGDGGPNVTCKKPTQWASIKPVNVGGNLMDISPTLSDDELTIAYVSLLDPVNPQGPRAAYVALRGDASAPFGPSTPMFGPNGPQYISSVCFGPRGDEVFASASPLIPPQRFKKDAGTYSDGVNQTGLDTTFDVEVCRSLIADAGVMYLHGENGSTANTAVFRAVRNGSDAWGALSAQALGDGGADRFPVVRADELEIFFSRRNGNKDEIFTATRTMKTDPWGTATKVTELAGFGSDSPGWLSPDGCRLYFSSLRGDAGSIDVYVATRSP